MAPPPTGRLGTWSWDLSGPDGSSTGTVVYGSDLSWGAPTDEQGCKPMATCTDAVASLSASRGQCFGGGTPLLDETLRMLKGIRDQGCCASPREFRSLLRTAMRLVEEDDTCPPAWPVASSYVSSEQAHVSSWVWNAFHPGSGASHSARFLTAGATERAAVGDAAPVKPTASLPAPVDASSLEGTAAKAFEIDNGRCCDPHFDYVGSGYCCRKFCLYVACSPCFPPVRVPAGCSVQSAGTLAWHVASGLATDMARILASCAARCLLAPLPHFHNTGTSRLCCFTTQLKNAVPTASTKTGATSSALRGLDGRRLSCAQRDHRSVCMEGTGADGLQTKQYLVPASPPSSGISGAQSPSVRPTAVMPAQVAGVARTAVLIARNTSANHGRAWRLCFSRLLLTLHSRTSRSIGQSLGMAGAQSRRSGVAGLEDFSVWCRACAPPRL